MPLEIAQKYSYHQTLQECCSPQLMILYFKFVHSTPNIVVIKHCKSLTINWARSARYFLYWAKIKWPKLDCLYIYRCLLSLGFETLIEAVFPLS